MYECLMDLDNCGVCGGGGLGSGGQRGGNWDNCNRITVKKINKLKKPMQLNNIK